MLKEDDPRGTVEELLKIGANLTKVRSCSRRRRDEDNRVVVVGCPVRSKCELAEKDGKGPVGSGCNGAGPCGKGIEAIKVMPDGKRVVSRMSMWCFHIPGFRKRVESRGYQKPDGTMEYGIVRVVANEGEVINVAGSTVEDKMVPGQGMTRIVNDGPQKETVRKFPRPGTAGNMPDAGLAAEMIDKVRAERKLNAPARLLGVEDENAEAPEARG